ncbi:pentapeptide repeat-containing protein [Acetobacteroides hydrogenigenes]|uniref:Uncharacterized protein YjbI with pentapeptide repeats n=1 Tax=Acetobacteroides hydrogenigenes TaxID=979970 RepID=A0A4R2EJF6_9BACT|nr:pentapeptide repeat-containing protein [Acetobacteroides hydrogenigenes]TCN68445.1 uncharacterized protein YjbI with pentapeptide repeats [Acetobacteroides hydrogenigenes]
MVYDDEIFSNVSFAEIGLDGVEYDSCRFENCDFSGVSFSGIELIDCHFVNCDFSLVKLDGTGLKNATFTGCKLIGVDFSVASNFLFAVSFADCMLDYSIFLKKNMKGTTFRNSSVKSAMFEECNLSNAILDSCNFANTLFVQNNLQQADFRTSTEYSFDLELNRVKGAKFAYPSALGLFSKYGIEIE